VCAYVICDRARLSKRRIGSHNDAYACNAASIGSSATSTIRGTWTGELPEDAMQARSVEHETIAIERDLKAAPARVFAAWASPKARARWAVPNEQWESVEQGNDFRVAGYEVSRFGPKGNARYKAETNYLDIVPDRRIIMAGTMFDADQPISCSLATVEFLSVGGGTRNRRRKNAANPSHPHNSR
jgi:uncharacterized protein YndB with AHSA1/START domain